jgi:surfeit locus 1 family protein
VREKPPSPLKAVLALTGAGLAFMLLIALGVWQLERRVWKLNLIAETQARTHAAAVPAPDPGDLAGLQSGSFVYRPVVVEGRFLNDKETLVQALSELGPGYWVMTPLETTRGFTVLINRGFVPDEKADPRSRQQGQIAGPTLVRGLLRASEPGGGFLHHNNPAGGRWYSRDVQAIAAASGLRRAAPYFIDANASPNPGGYPVGGLTVIRFPNNHLVYALTWFSMAGGVLLLTGAAVRQERARRPSRALELSDAAPREVG